MNSSSSCSSSSSSISGEQLRCPFCHLVVIVVTVGWAGVVCGAVVVDMSLLKHNLDQSGTFFTA